MRSVGNGFVWVLCIILAGPAMAATITVTTTDDEPLTTTDPGTCSLREAIQAVINTRSEDGCPAGSPDSADTPDTIAFSLPILPATITLSATLPTISSVDDGLTIRGPGSDSRQLTISGANSFRVFRIAGGEAVTIEGLTIANGRIDDGGGVLNQGNLTIKNATIRDNVGTDDGGGINNGGNLRVENSTFTGNSTNEEGGGVVNFQNATFVNTTFSGNRAGLTAAVGTMGTDGGGAIFNSGGTVTLISCTIAGNTNVGGTLMGDGIFTEDDNSAPRIAQTTLQNTLVAANDDDNCMATGQNPIADSGGNLDDGVTCDFTDPTSLPNVPAGLAAALQNNGGPTDTIALTAASAAIDSVENCAAAGSLANRDQRGAPRPIDGDGDGNASCDVGAFESDAASPQPNQPPVVTNPGNQTGVVGAIVNLPISASDPNGNTLSYSATGLPAGLSINAATGVVTGTLSTAGTSNVTGTVSDGQGGTAFTGFIWTVTMTAEIDPPPPNTPPPPDIPLLPPPPSGSVPNCSGHAATVFVRDGITVGGRDSGLPYHGRLRGTGGADVMVGTAGNDVLEGFGGNDWICAGPGNDLIKGGTGNDELFGEPGRDKLIGGAGSDRCRGGRGTDKVASCQRIVTR